MELKLPASNYNQYVYTFWRVSRYSQMSDAVWVTLAIYKLWSSGFRREIIPSFQNWNFNFTPLIFVHN